MLFSVVKERQETLQNEEFHIFTLEQKFIMLIHQQGKDGQKMYHMWALRNVLKFWFIVSFYRNGTYQNPEGEVMLNYFLNFW